MSTDDTNDDTSVELEPVEIIAPAYDDLYDDEELVDKPLDYFNKKHFKWILKRVPSVVLLGLAIIMFALIALPPLYAMLMAILSVAASTYASMRYFAEFRLRPLKLPVSSGGLVVSQAGGKVFPWFLTSSTREVFPLDLYRLETPDLTLSERLLFRNCGTLEIKSLASEKSVMTIKDVKNPRHMVDIYEWRLDEKARRENFESESAQQTPGLLRALGAKQDRTNELLESIDDSMKLIVGHFTE